MLLLIFLIILIVVLVIGLYCLIYFEIPRYMDMNKKTWEDVIYLDKKYSYLPRVNIQSRTIISMTTIPSRIDKIAPTLCSILSQTRKVDEIRLNIPYRSRKGKKYIIPKHFKKFRHIKIYRVHKDLGPSTKLLPTLRDEDPNTNVIVMDDDMIYGSKVVQLLVKSFKQHKCKDVITNYGCNKSDNRLTRLSKFFWGNEYVYLLFGCGGYILKVSMLPEEVFDYDQAPKEAICVDDNWISGWLWLNGIKIYTLGINKGTTFIPNRETANTVALCDTINYDKSNNHVVDKWFERRKRVKR